MNIVFMGTPSFSVPILETLHKLHPISLVVTQPDMPLGRKQIVTSSPVKLFAESKGIPLFQPSNIKQDYQKVLDAKPDIIVTAAYGQIIPDILLKTPKHKAINVHGSLLPKLRGGAPIQRAIERNFQTTGISIIYMESKMDSGDIILQKSIPIDSFETGSSLFEKLSQLAKEVLPIALAMIEKNQVKKTPQNPQEVTFAYTIKRNEELLDFNQPAQILEAKIRAFYEQPNTYTFLNQTRLKIITANHINTQEHDHIKNGTIVGISNQGIRVKCQVDILEITTLQLAGKKIMSSPEFMNGVGKKLINVGTKLN